MRFVAIMPRRMGAGDLGLRPLRLSDAPFLARILGRVHRREGLLRGRLQRVVLWLGLRRAARPGYVVTLHGDPIGFIGLYELQLGCYGKLALCIDPTLRRRGHATRAFALFRKSLERHRLVSKVIAEVERHNVASLSLLVRLGYTPVAEERGRKVLALTLGEADAGGGFPESCPSGAKEGLLRTAGRPRPGSGDPSKFLLDAVGRST